MWPNTSTFVFNYVPIYEQAHCYPHKKSFRKKFGRNINPNCVKQNQLRREFKKKLPKSVQPIEDSVYGVDYLYKGIKIDQKFSFGDLGEHAIKIRTQNRRLLNKSDWTLLITRDETIEMFETKKLAEFVKRNWDLVQKRTIEKKTRYNSHIVSLDDLYYIEKIAPIKSDLIEDEIAQTLNDLTIQVIDYAHKVCLLNCLF